MGLHSYLEKHHYVKRCDHMEPEELHWVTVAKGGQAADYIKPERVAYVIEQVGYWRRANQIHKWFVENVQGGEDDCREYRVSRDQLRELLTLAQTVIKEPKSAGELLPTEGRFFFGGTEYDEDYFDDLKGTVETLTALLAEPDEGDFYYRASW